MTNRKYKICFFTGTRAEYGLLKYLMREILISNQFTLQLIVTGSHLSEKHGYTVKEIYEDGFKKFSHIFKKVDDAPKVFDVIVMSMGSTLISNHCALYVDNNRILHAMVDHTSWVSPYGNYYQQYTTGVYRWTGLTS